jgi:zinc transport system substrate-binding protein
MRFNKWVSGSLASILLVSCGSLTTPPEGSKKISIMTSFLPITLFARAVAGECGDVKALIPTNIGPHDFQSTPKDILSIGKADVFFINGLGMETFLDRLISSAASTTLSVVDTSVGIKTISTDISNADSYSDPNPHIWLDPIRAISQVETIKDALVDLNPACSEVYTSNALAYVDNLLALHAEILSKLEPYQGKSFIAYHDFAPYFAERYQLKAEYLVDLPDINPSPADLQRVSNLVRDSDLKALLTEPQDGSNSFNSLARDLNIKIALFNPIETISQDFVYDESLYFDLMRDNLSNLLLSLGG